MRDIDDELADLEIGKPEKKLHSSLFRKLVGITFLADVVGKQPAQIRKKLEKCPVRGWENSRGTDQPRYNFLEAIAYLVPPQGNIEDWMASKNAATLPPYINKMYWESVNARSKSLRDSNDLWHTDEVLIFLGRIAMMIKEETKMWIEDMPEKDMLTNEQFGTLMGATDRLNDQIRKRMVDLPNVSQTRASLSRQVESELEDAGDSPMMASD